MVKKFREALQDALTRTGWNLKAVCATADVSYDQMKKVRSGNSQSTNVDDAVKIANAFGVSIAEFLDDTTAIDRIESVSLWLQLTEGERAILKDAALGRSAQTQAGD